MPAIVDRIAKRADIVRHAADVFARHGYHATKMQDIASKADIGKGTIYEYFRTKEELFLAIYDAWMGEFEQTISNRVAAAADAMSKVDAIRESAVEFYESRAEQAPLLLEFWAHALRTDNPAFLERVRRMRTYLRDLGASLTRELTAAGWFHDIDATAFAELETGISDGIFLAWLMRGRDFPLAKAFTFRQSVIGLGLLSAQGRSVVEEKLTSKLKRGF
ncbi:MAG: TetR/AcrR family transcriptional regulator [Candidatus Kapabacteria bacterium]|nr:TetR/AcrR family transcriptional regulator [Candidatus Kapabacteria bacterium]